MDRQQLVGDLAVRAGLIHPDQLDQAKKTLAADQSLGQALVQQGHLTDHDREHLEYLADRSLARQSSLPLESPLPTDALGDLTPPPPGLAEDKTLGASALAVTSGTAIPSTGRYLIQRLHATGGIGRVWVAFDERLQREVALKDLRPETASHTKMRQRFLEEGRVTGQLEHPGIVPVYEMATRPEDGQPYYVMRFVKGRTLSAAIRQHQKKLGEGQAQPVEFRELLQDFVTVCKTVAFAHSRGVLHRDLKPANVLLGDFGEVLVLDWGLAKVVASGAWRVASEESAAQRPGESSPLHPFTPSPLHSLAPHPSPLTPSSDLTRQGHVVGTPAYMAPEQAAGEIDRIDARTDVWGLGAILYEILTGRAPFAGRPTEIVLLKVREDDPAPPRSIQRTVPAALEAICLKALAKAPDQRYPTTTDLAHDVQAWLADEPVSARRDPLLTRLGRWARRHKTVVAAASVLLVTGVVALAVTNVLVGQQRARAEAALQTALEARAEANLQAARAEANLQTALDAVDRFFVQVSEDRLLDEPGMQDLRTDLLKSAREFFDRFVQENEADSARQADLARVLILWARSSSRTKDSEKALKSLERAEQILKTLHDKDPTNSTWQRGLGECHLLRGFFTMLSDPPGSETEFRRAIDKLKPLSTDEKAREKLAMVYNNLAAMVQRREQFDQAEELFNQALNTLQPLVEQDVGNIKRRLDMAGFYNNLAGLYDKRKNYAKTRHYLEKSLALREQTAAEGYHGLDLQSDFEQSYTNFGHLGLREKRSEQAEQYFRKALKAQEALVCANPAVKAYRQKLASGHYFLGTALGNQSAYDDALEHMGKSVGGYKLLRREFPKEIVFQLDLGRSLLSMGYLQDDAAKLALRTTDCPVEKLLAMWNHALDCFARAIVVFEDLKTLQQADPAVKTDLMNAHWTRAQVLHRLGRFAEAMPHWDRALKLADPISQAKLQEERENTVKKLKK